MIIDARENLTRAKRIQVIDTESGEMVERVVAINTMSQVITFSVTEDERKTLFEKYRDERYESGKYILRDKKTGLEWSATEVTIPCLQQDGVDLVDCPCLDCLPF